MSYTKLDTANKLMLLQGISLIEDGIRFLQWADTPNENSFDMLGVLRNRFETFKEFALDNGECDKIFIDKAQVSLNNVRYGQELNEKIKSELQTLKVNAWNEYKKHNPDNE